MSRRDGLGRRILVLAALACLGAGGGALAADRQVVLRADVSARQIGVEDQVQLAITLEGPSIDLREELQLPPLTNLTVVAGPSVATQVSFVNGRISQARTITYLLQPADVGTATVGPVRAVLADGVRTTEPITIEVHPGSLLPTRRPPSSPAYPFGDDEDPFAAFFGRREAPRQVKVFVEAAVDRTRLFVGEGLLLTYWLYTQTAIAGLDVTEAPRYPGFWVEALPREATPPAGEAVTRDGEPFTRFAVMRRLLFPTKPGQATIPAATFTVAVPRRVGPFADPFPSAASSLNRTTRPVEITVDPLPTDPSFSGAVGQFRVTASVDREGVTLGEAVTYRFRIHGRGNLKWVDRAPSLTVPEAKVYPPQAKDEFTASAEGLVGARTFEFVLVPETAGVLTIPAVDFTYFDPQARRLVNATTPPLHVQVLAGAAATTAMPVAAAPALAETTALRLRSDLEPAPMRVPTTTGTTLALALGTTAAAHLLLWGAPLLLARSSRRTSASGRSARRALADLRRAARGGLPKEAAAILIENALFDVFGTIDERPAEDDNERTATLRAILRDARFVRYAPQLGDYTEKLEEIAGRAREAIRRWA